MPQIRCPDCGNEWEVSATLRGLTVVCKTCQARVAFTTEPKKSAVPEARTPVPATKPPQPPVIAQQGTIKPHMFESQEDIEKRVPIAEEPRSDTPESEPSIKISVPGGAPADLFAWGGFCAALMLFIVGGSIVATCVFMARGLISSDPDGSSSFVLFLAGLLGIGILSGAAAIYFAFWMVILVPRSSGAQTWGRSACVATGLLTFTALIVIYAVAANQRWEFEQARRRLDEQTKLLRRIDRFDRDQRLPTAPATETRKPWGSTELAVLRFLIQLFVHTANLSLLLCLHTVVRSLGRTGLVNGLAAFSIIYCIGAVVALIASIFDHTAVGGLFIAGGGSGWLATMAFVGMLAWYVAMVAMTRNTIRESYSLVER